MASIAGFFQPAKRLLKINYTVLFQPLFKMLVSANSAPSATQTQTNVFLLTESLLLIMI